MSECIAVTQFAQDMGDPQRPLHFPPKTRPIDHVVLGQENGETPWYVSTPGMFQQSGALDFDLGGGFRH